MAVHLPALFVFRLLFPKAGAAQEATASSRSRRRRPRPRGNGLQFQPPLSAPPAKACDAAAKLARGRWTTALSGRRYLEHSAGILMDQEVKDLMPSRSPSEPSMFLQWGSRKRLRCVKTRDDGSPSPSEVRRRAVPRTTRPLDIAPFRSPRRPSTLHRRKSDSLLNEYKQSMALSPDKDRYYSTRGSPFPFEGNGFDFGGGAEEKGTTALPRFFIALSNKEKEEDFFAMKGCKLPQRPKKRPKLMQKCLLMVSPGAWLSDLSHERYEVREKKGSRKRARGLKALSMESDSE